MNRYRTIVRATARMAVLVAVAWLSAEGLANAAYDVEDILRDVDRARGRMDGIEWQVRIEAKERGRTTRESFHVRARAGDILAVTEEPATRRGNTILVQEGRVWFTRPGLSRPVPISHRQRLLGLADYGDLAATNYAEHYTAIALPDEDMYGNPCRVFDLRARHRSAPYDRVLLWVSRERGGAVRADYFTRTGQRLKTARLWHDHRVAQPDGTERWMCSRIELTSDLTGTDVTRIEFSPPVLAPLPESLFNVNRLGR